MTNNLIVATVLFTVLCISTRAQEFQKLYTSYSYESASTIAELPNGNFIIGGLSAGTGPSNADFLILCVDPMGDEVWSEVYTAGGSGELKDIKIINDNEILLTGYVTLVGDGGSAQAFVGKMTIDGDWIWQKSIGGIAMETGKTIELTSDGGFLLTSLSSSYSEDYNQDILLVKGDLDGNIEWTKVYGTSGYENVLKSIETPEGGFFVWGHMNNEYTESYDNFLMKTDINGNLLWVKSFVGPIVELAWDIIAVSDGAILSGDTNSIGEGMNEMYAIKVNWNGDVQWKYTFGSWSNDHAITLSKNGDDHFILGGISASFGSGGLDFMAMNLDLDGNIVWTKIYGGDGKEVMFKVIKTEDQGFILAGNSKSFSEDSAAKLYIIKTNERGDCECNQTLDAEFVRSEASFIEVERDFNEIEVDTFAEMIEMEAYGTDEMELETLCSFGFIVDEDIIGGNISQFTQGNSGEKEMHSLLNETQSLLLKIYPNPSKGIFKFKLNEVETEETIEILVLNTDGQQVLALSSTVYSSGDIKMINLEGFKPGIYTVVIHSESIIETQRIILN